MTTLPGIIQQRWAAACAAPSYLQWASICAWFNETAEVFATYADTQHLAGPLREMANEAERNMLAMMPAREAA